MEEGNRTLKLWEEVVGHLEYIHISDDEEGFHVKMDDIFEFMSFEKGYTNLLKEIINIPRGSKIGILRTDDGYRVRVIE